MSEDQVRCSSARSHEPSIAALLTSRYGAENITFAVTIPIAGHKYSRIICWVDNIVTIVSRVLKKLSHYC